jgi:hydrogenase maturation protease
MHLVRDPLPRSDSRARVAVVGLGSQQLRGDDAAGLEVVRRLTDLECPRITVREHGGDMLGLVELLERREAVLVVDAVSSGARPGSLLRLNAAAGPLPRAAFECSSHALGVADAIELARSLGRLPPTLFVYGIEGSEWRLGAPMSTSVAAAVPGVAAAVRRHALALRTAIWTAHRHNS